MKKHSYLLILFFLFPLSLLAQQTVTISGKITDADSKTPIPGAVISASLPTGKRTVSTNNTGNYTITLPASTTELTFSYVGMKSITEKINGRQTINVALFASQSDLDEVVVVGYGTQKKVTLTGAVSTLKNDELTVTKNENVVNMLTGKIPGVRVLQKSSEPGSFDNSFDIRGMGNPLVVIDGVPRSDISRMDASEIESISVLKDASAAIYGVRSANGVILITTKKGSSKNGKFDISYSVNNGWQSFLNLPDGVDALDYMMLKNEKIKRDFGQNFFNPRAPAFSAADMELYQSGKLKSSDWTDAVLKKSALQVQHNLNVNGGNDKVNYFFNLGYMKQDGVFKSGDINYDRYNFRSNVNVKITDRLRAEVLVSGYMDTKNQPDKSVWEVFKYTWNQLPTDQIYANNNPEYPHVMPDNANPVVITDKKYGGYKIYKNKNFQGQLSLQYDIPGISGLMAKGMYSYGYTPNDNTEVHKSYSLYNYDTEKQIYIPSLVNSPSTVNRYYGVTQSTLSQLSLNYAKTIAGVHNITGLLLFEESRTTGDNFYATRELALPLDYLFAGSTNNQVGYMNVGGLYENVNKGLVGKFNYDYKGKYIAEVSFRYDGSSKYNPASGQWGLFPAASVGWRLSEESFVKNIISSNVLNNLKIRASYGKLGDDSSDPYQFVAGFNYPGQGYIFGGNYVNGLSSRGVVNPDFTWFTAKTLDVGLDFELWKGLLGGSVDYYVRNRSGLPARRTTSLPGTVGTNLPLENLNSDRTKGIELLVTHRNRIGQVGYNISGNISSTRTMQVNVQETRAGNSYENWKNSQSNRYTNIWWGKDYGGQFNNYNQIYNFPVNTGGGNQNVVPGDYYYQDWNGDGVIDGKDEHPIATRNLPLVNFGMTLGANWKGFDVNVLLQGATMFNVQYAEQLAEPLMYDRSALTMFLDRWHTKDPGASVFDPNTVWIPGYYPAMGSPKAEGTRAVQNATYLRIKTLEFGYTLPKKLLNKAKIAGLRVYVNSYNLATLTGLKNSDPEHPGVEDNFDNYLGGYKYPLNRTFNIGANVTF